MPAYPNFARSKAGLYGTALLVTSTRLGTGGTSVGGSGTTSLILPKPPATSCQLVSLNFNALIAALSNGGTVLAQVFKRDNSGTPADRTLTSTKSLEADIVTVLDASYTIAITATSVQNLTFQSSDDLRLDVVATSSIDTQPTITVNALWAIVKP